MLERLCEENVHVDMFYYKKPMKDDDDLYVLTEDEKVVYEIPSNYHSDNSEMYRLSDDHGEDFTKNIVPNIEIGNNASTHAVLNNNFFANGLIVNAKIEINANIDLMEDGLESSSESEKSRDEDSHHGSDDGIDDDD